MTSSRPWIATWIALSCALAAVAQTDTTGSGSSGGSSSGGSSPGGNSSGTGGTSGTGTSGSSPPPSSAFSSTSSTPSTSGTGTSGASSSFGGTESTTGGTSGTGTGSFFDIFSTNGGGAQTATPAPSRPQQAPPSFTLPGFYGQGSQTLYGGYGRLARPDFELSLSFSVGYDDNVFQTPSSNTPSIIPGGSQVIEPGREAVIVETIRTRTVSGGGTVQVPVFSVIPGTADTIRTEDLVLPPAQRLGSFLTQSNLKLEMQHFTRRSLFTLDLAGGRTYYWDKDEDPVDYNGNIGANYLYRITPRLQMTAALDAAYLSQPDLSRANTPERQTRGDVINTLGRFDLSYRATSRVSTTVSASYAGIRYTDKAEETGNYDQWTLGLEARYLWKPRWTLLAELRHTITKYANDPTLDSTSEFLLVGSEFVLSRRLSGSLRLGSSVKSFDVGSNQTAPYLESSVTYRSTARSSVLWTNRFGFEESASPDDERLVYRSTINYSYAFTPRLRGSAAINLLHEVNTNKKSDTKFAQDTFDSNIGLDYQLTKRFGLNASYAFTIVNSNVGVTDYYRNRIYFGGQLTF